MIIHNPQFMSKSINPTTNQKVIPLKQSIFMEQLKQYKPNIYQLFYDSNIDLDTKACKTKKYKHKTKNKKPIVETATFDNGKIIFSAPPSVTNNTKSCKADEINHNECLTITDNLLNTRQKAKIFVNVITNNSHLVTDIRMLDGFVSATKLCKSAGKEWKHYNENQNTKKFLNMLAIEMKILSIDLVKSKKGGNILEQGTWVHPDVAIHLAQWCLPLFSAKFIKQYTTEQITIKELQLAFKPLYEDTYLSTYSDKNVLYIGYLGKNIDANEHIFKLGLTNRIFMRQLEHIKFFGSFTLIFLIESDNNKKCEQLIKNELKSRKLNRESFDNKSSIELFTINEANNIGKIKQLFTDIVKLNPLPALTDANNKIKSLEESINIREKTLDIELIKTQTLNDECKIKQMELQYKLAELEIKKIELIKTNS